MACAVLNQAGVELAALAKIVMNRIFGNGEAIPLAVSGGVFCNCELVRRVFYDRLRAEYPRLLLNAALVEPAKGALELARKGNRS